MIRMVLWVLLGVGAGLLFQRYVEHGMILDLIAGMFALCTALVNVVILWKTERISTF